MSKMSNKLSSSIGLILFLGVVGGCGEPSALSHRGTNSALPVAGDLTTKKDFESITTFSQSLQSLTFEFNPKDRSATLNYGYYDFDKLDDKGLPYSTFISGLLGTIAADGTGILTNREVPKQSAKIQCADASCGNVKIDINKEQGKYSGVAVVNITTFRGVNTFLMLGDKKSKKDPARIGALLDSWEPKTTDLTLIEIVNGRNNLFKIAVNFSKDQLPGSTEPAFDSKKVAVEGPIGKDVSVGLGDMVSRSGVTTAGGSQYRADVTFDPKRSLVEVSFLKDDGLIRLWAGVTLFDQKK